MPSLVEVRVPLSIRLAELISNERLTGPHNPHPPPACFLTGLQGCIVTSQDGTRPTWKSNPDSGVLLPTSLRQAAREQMMQTKQPTQIDQYLRVRLQSLKSCLCMVARQQQSPSKPTIFPKSSAGNAP